MKPTEAVTLCRIVKAYCPHQQIDEFTADAYGEILEPYTFADAHEAVKTLGGQQPFISPAEIATEIKRVRAKRITDYGPIEPPASLDPDNAEAYRDWLADMAKRIADGDLTPEPPIPLDLDQRDVIGELGHIGHEMPGHD